MGVKVGYVYPSKKVENLSFGGSAFFFPLIIILSLEYN